jgi:hypothetical protein
MPNKLRRLRNRTPVREAEAGCSCSCSRDRIEGGTLSRKQTAGMLIAVEAFKILAAPAQHKTDASPSAMN